MTARYRWLLVLIGAWLVLPLVLHAQTGPQADPGTTPGMWYTSALGISGVTVGAVSLLKRMLANVPYLKSAPTWAYAVLVSAGLTYLANAVWGTMPGETWQLLSQAVSNAASASGFYEWISAPTTSIRDSALSAKVKGVE